MYPRMVSRCPAVTTGPTSDVASSGSPTCIAPTRSARPSSTASSCPRGTISRVNAEQDWPLLTKPAAHGHRQGGGEVAVVQQHERGLAAELQRDPLDCASGLFGDADPGLGRPGDADHVDLGMPGEQVADLSSGPTDDVDGAWRQAERRR